MQLLDGLNTDIELNNSMLKRGCGVDWPCGKVQLISPKEQTISKSKLYWIELAFDGGRILVGQSEVLLSSMLEKYLDTPGLEKLPDNLKEGLIAIGLDSWLTSLESRSGASSSISFCGTECLNLEPGSLMLEYDAVLPSGQQGRFVLGCDDSMRPIIKGVVDSLPPTGASNNIKQKLPLLVSLRIGSCRLPIQDAWNLEVGDVVLMEPVYSDNRSRVQARVGTTHAISAGYDSNGNIKIMNDAGELKMEKLVEEEHALSTDDQVSVRLDFEVGRKEISYSELSELTEGYVFDLGKQLSTGVAIRCGWRTVARGELIEIGESRLGVRVVDATQLSTHDMDESSKMPTTVDVNDSSEMPATVDVNDVSEMRATVDVNDLPETPATASVNDSSEMQSTVDVNDSTEMPATVDVNDLSEMPATVDVNDASEIRAAVDVNDSSVMPATVDMNDSSELPAS